MRKNRWRIEIIRKEINTQRHEHFPQLDFYTWKSPTKLESTLFVIETAVNLFDLIPQWLWLFFQASFQAPFLAVFDNDELIHHPQSTQHHPSFLFHPKFTPFDCHFLWVNILNFWAPRRQTSCFQPPWCHPLPPIDNSPRTQEDLLGSWSLIGVVTAAQRGHHFFDGPWIWQWLSSPSGQFWTPMKVWKLLP